MKVLLALLAGENVLGSLPFFPTHSMVIFQRIIKEEVFFLQIAVNKMETLVIQIREKISNLTRNL